MTYDIQKQQQKQERTPKTNPQTAMGAANLSAILGHKVVVW